MGVGTSEYRTKCQENGQRRLETIVLSHPGLFMSYFLAFSPYLQAFWPLTVVERVIVTTK